MNGPLFQLPWKLTAGQSIDVTYPTGGATYHLVLTAGDEFDSVYDFLIWMYDEMVAEIGGVFIWPVLNGGGIVSLVSKFANFDFAWNDPVGGGIGALMGFSSMTASNVVSYTAGAVPHRTFNPGIRLLEAPTFSRRLSAPMALSPLLSGHRHTVQVVNPDSPGGFRQARFVVSMVVPDADFTAQDYTAGQFYRLFSFLSGERDANQIFELQDGTYAGYNGTTDIENCTAFDELDELPPGGASENPYSYFTAWLDPDGAEVAGDYENYRDEIGRRQSIWHLHPDTTRIEVSTQYDRMRTYWIAEWDAFTEEVV